MQHKWHPEASARVHVLPEHPGGHEPGPSRGSRRQVPQTHVGWVAHDGIDLEGLHCEEVVSNGPGWMNHAATDGLTEGVTGELDTPDFGAETSPFALLGKSGDESAAAHARFKHAIAGLAQCPARKRPGRHRRRVVRPECPMRAVGKRGYGIEQRTHRFHARAFVRAARRTGIVLKLLSGRSRQADELGAG